jgi:4-hydroxy-tetrahydrodipicolinate reductase
MTIRVAVAGASGKLGSVAVRLVEQSAEFELVATGTSRTPLEALLGPPDSPSDLVVDMTVPSASAAIVEFAVRNGRNVLVGTSGWSADRLVGLESLLRELPDRGVVVVPNFSLGSVLATRLAAVAARFFDSIEIVETHHAGKVDSPSGTAVRTAEAIAASRGERGPVQAPRVDQRARGQQVASVPIHSLRMHGVAAKQEVLLGGTGELVSIGHEVIDSSAYEAGILLALPAAAGATGLTVGLDSLIDLGLGGPAADSASEPVADAPSGQVAASSPSDPGAR